MAADQVTAPQSEEQLGPTSWQATARQKASRFVCLVLSLAEGEQEDHDPAVEGQETSSGDSSEQIDACENVPPWVRVCSVAGKRKL